MGHTDQHTYLFFFFLKVIRCLKASFIDISEYIHWNKIFRCFLALTEAFIVCISAKIFSCLFLYNEEITLVKEENKARPEQWDSWYVAVAIFFSEYFCN